MPERDRRALVLCIVGLLVVLTPTWILATPGGPVGPFLFVLLMVQGITGVIGLGVTAVGYRSYRSGDLRPVVAVGVCIAVLIGIWTAGYVVETSVAPVAPYPLWFVFPIVVGPPLGYLLGYRRGALRS